MEKSAASLIISFKNGINLIVFVEEMAFSFAFIGICVIDEP